MGLFLYRQSGGVSIMIWESDSNTNKGTQKMAAKSKTFWVADSTTDIDNGWTVTSRNAIGSASFWADCDEQVEPFEGFRIAKAVEVDCDCSWIGDIIWR
jgi:hypothetical protein